MNAVLVVACAVVGVVAILALTVWLIGLVEARQEARELEAMQEMGPSILGAGPRHLRRGHAPVLGAGPRHLRRRQPPT